MATELTSAMVKEYGINAGANVVGIAVSKDFDLAPDGFKPTDVLPECLSVIVLGTTFPREVLDDIAEYSASRNAMLTKMTDIAKKIEKRIKADGYKTKVISAAGGKWVEACPARALDDLASFGKKGCSRFFKIENKEFVIKCFSCRTICPYCFGI